MTGSASSTVGLVVSALLLALLLGVVFSHVFPEVGVSTELGLLFAVVGLALSLAVRAGWRRLRGRRHAPAREA